jgi:hypothetical protein
LAGKTTTLLGAENTPTEVADTPLLEGAIESVHPHMKPAPSPATKTIARTAGRSGAKPTGGLW